MKAFVCHYTKLSDRKKYLDSKLPSLGFTDVEWVTENDIQTYNIDKVYDSSPNALAKRNETAFVHFGTKKQRPLKKAEIEITLQHFEAYRRIVDQKLPMAVVFEDDVLFKKTFTDRFHRYIEELPDDWDILYFGRGCGGHYAPMSISERFNNLFGKKHVFKNKECRSRFSDSYVITAQAAEMILAQCFPFHMPIDWELNYLQSSMGMNIYWSEPTITYQGSKSGAYSSSLKAPK